MSPAEAAERGLDAAHMQKELLFEGDTGDRPALGDVIKLHYTCTLAATGALVESTRKTRKVASGDWP